MIWIMAIQNDETCCRELQQEINKNGRFRCRSYYTSCDLALMNLAEDNPDVIIMDTDFDTGTPGTLAISLILKHLPGAKILILTDNDNAETIDDAFAHGALGYILRKEENIQDIYTAIDEAWNDKYHLNQTVLRKFMKHHILRPENNPLTGQQTTILRLTAAGFSTAEIALKLNLTVDDIKYHLKQIYDKLGVHTKLQAVLKAIALEIIESP